MKVKMFGIVLLSFLTGVLKGYAQEPVHWSYSVKKVSETAYEVHLIAAIAQGWHIYAMKQPPHAISKPTQITFSANPLLVVSGVAEKGNKIDDKNPVLGIEQYEYENQVDFIALVTTKYPVKSNITGSIVFQACTQKECMAPETKAFQVSLAEGQAQLEEGR
jgi:hypothetical protein